MRLLVIILFLSCLVFTAPGQEADTLDLMIGRIVEGDTVIHKNILEIKVLSGKKFRSKRQKRRYSRYIQKVKKVYPLAVKARVLLEKYEPEYYALEEQKDRRRLMKKLEKELLDEHKDELKKWSISDGRILLKLINRETTRTPYSLIRDFRGGFSAVFWQGIAKIFRNDLKAGYDPEEEDRILEEIVSLIERGYI